MNQTKRNHNQGSIGGVKLEDINLSYGKNHVLKGIDLKIKHSEFFAFLGPSGCGKTTLLRLIAGFETAQTGMFQVCPHGKGIWVWCFKVMRSGPI